MATSKIAFNAQAIYGLSGIERTNNTTETINYDTETRFCVYTNGIASSGTKPVVNKNGFLITIVRELNVTHLQFFVERGGSRLYQRSMESSVWGAWRSIAFS